MELDTTRMLRDAGLRVTRPRTAVLVALGERPHADAAEVIDAVRLGSTGVSRQAVYDCLDALTDAGLVRRFRPIGTAARYEIRTGDNHHHLVCRGCGLVIDVPCATGEAPCLTPADGHGFTIAEAEVTYRGLCPDCAATSRA